MRHLRPVLLVFLLASCSTAARLGRDLPLCDEEQTGQSITMQVLAVPTATFGPCIDDLPLGWEYVHQEAESGRARFWIDSDRLGDAFLEVTLAESCDTSRAFHIHDPAPGIEALSEGPLTVDPVAVTVIPRSTAAEGYATEVAIEVSGTQIRGRPVQARLDIRDLSTDRRLEEAQAAGEFTLMVGMTDEIRETVQLFLPGHTEGALDTLEDALGEIEDEVAEPQYRASWFFLFQGGCIEWKFDAEGEGLGTLQEDATNALGFYDLADLREWAIRSGLMLED